jgi:hypothetical protein
LRGLYIEIDGSNRICAGGPDVSFLTLTLVLTRGSETATLAISGLKASRFGAFEPIEWIRRELGAGQSLRLRPDDHPKPCDETNPIAKLAARSAEPYGLNVRLSDGTAVSAHLEAEDQLQLVLAWHVSEDQIRIEVDALTVADSGFSSGRRWLETKSLIGNEILIDIDGKTS